MKVLFVDDDPSRLPALGSLLLSAKVLSGEIVHRLSAEELTDADLRAADVVFLDHDLCAAHYPFPLPCPAPKEDGACSHGSGATIVRRIHAGAGGPPRPSRRFVVHSLSHRAPAMAHRLQRDGHYALLAPIDTWRVDAVREALIIVLRDAGCRAVERGT